MKRSKKTKSKQITQKVIARMIAKQFKMTIHDVEQVVELEQKLTMDYIRQNKRVVKRGFITLVPSIHEERKMKSPLDGKEYLIPSRTTVSVRVSDDFRTYLNEEAEKKEANHDIPQS